MTSPQTSPGFLERELPGHVYAALDRLSQRTTFGHQDPEKAYQKIADRNIVVAHLRSQDTNAKTVFRANFEGFGHQDTPGYQRQILKACVALAAWDVEVIEALGAPNDLQDMVHDQGIVDLFLEALDHPQPPPWDMASVIRAWRKEGQITGDIFTSLIFLHAVKTKGVRGGFGFLRNLGITPEGEGWHATILDIVTYMPNLPNTNTTTPSAMVEVLRPYVPHFNPHIAGVVLHHQHRKPRNILALLLAGMPLPTQRHQIHETTNHILNNLSTGHARMALEAWKRRPDPWSDLNDVDAFRMLFGTGG